MPSPQAIKAVEVRPFTTPAGSVAGALALALVFLIPGLGPSYNLSLAWGWALCAAMLVVFCAMVGLAINQRLAGLIIDNRNCVSLSKFQAVAWSVLVLSALITAVFARLHLHVPTPINVAIPGELLATMGISATSLVAAPVILSLKSGEEPRAGQQDATALKLGDNVEDLSSTGKVYARKDPAKAQWLDMFRGDEISNAASPDLGKLQQFLITIVVLMVYGAGLWGLFSGPRDNPPFASLPVFSANMTLLIGISHAGYLAYKAAPHGSSGDASSSASAGSPTPATDNAAG